MSEYQKNCYRINIEGRIQIYYKLSCFKNVWRQKAFVATEKKYLTLLFSNATFTGTHLHLRCRRVLRRRLCCYGSLFHQCYKKQQCFPSECTLQGTWRYKHNLWLPAQGWWWFCFLQHWWNNSLPLDWKSVESCSFTSFNMTFNFSTIALCSLMEKFSFLPSLGFNRYPGMENSLALSEQPSALRLLLLLVRCQTAWIVQL